MKRAGAATLKRSRSGLNADEVERLRAISGELARGVMVRGPITQVSFEVLGLLDRNEPMTSADLAHLRSVRPQTMAVMVKELVEQGLLEGRPHEVDRRKIVLDLTEAGRELLLADRRARAERLDQALAEELSPSELDAVARALPLLERLAVRLRDTPQP